MFCELGHLQIVSRLYLEILLTFEIVSKFPFENLCFIFNIGYKVMIVFSNYDTIFKNNFYQFWFLKKPKNKPYFFFDNLFKFTVGISKNHAHYMIFDV